MTKHKTGTRDEWLTARIELLKAEKELTRRRNELARRRLELPWVRVDKEYRFDTGDGSASLANLFGNVISPAPTFITGSSRRKLCSKSPLR